MTMVYDAGERYISKRGKDIGEILAILIVFMLVVSCAVTPSEEAVSESEEGAHQVDELAEETITDLDTAQYSIKEATTSAYDYVIVTTNSVITNLSNNIPNLDDFVQYLESNQGHRVTIITEDEYGQAEGQQRAINIRNWLVDNYQGLGIRYVLLIGNPDPDDPTNATDSYGDIPMLMCWPLKDIEPDFEGCPTDHFYADLTGNWEIEMIMEYQKAMKYARRLSSPLMTALH
jgi:uncharacterized protein YpmB